MIINGTRDVQIDLEIIWKLAKDSIRRELEDAVCYDIDK